MLGHLRDQVVDYRVPEREILDMLTVRLHVGSERDSSAPQLVLAVLRVVADEGFMERDLERAVL